MPKPDYPFLDHFMATISQESIDLKFQIKIFEAKLANYFSSTISDNLEAVTSLVKELSSCYKSYYQMQWGLEFEEIPENQFSNTQACFSAIQDLRHKLFKAHYNSHKKYYISLIYWHYQAMEVLLNSATIVNENPETLIPEKFSAFFQDVTSENFLSKIVIYWNNSDLVSFTKNSFLMGCSLQELQTWIYRFSDQAFINLSNSVFYFKLHPQALYDERLHPEKQVSLQARVDFLYQFIENLQKQILFLVNQYGLTSYTDYLLHGDEIPKGVNLTIPQHHKIIIRDAIKSWEAKHTSLHTGSSHLEKLQEILRAYKFWFNPNRLIDALMLLFQQMQLDKLDYLLFQAKIQKYMEHLTTIECLDLFGYFSNNDSTYLLRTLALLQSNEPNPWFPDLSSKQKNTLRHVFQIIRHTLYALKEELERRKLSTEIYPFEVQRTEALKPGQRILVAIQRVILLYEDLDKIPNAKLETLFSLVETDVIL